MAKHSRLDDLSTILEISRSGFTLFAMERYEPERAYKFLDSGSNGVYKNKFKISEDSEDVNSDIVFAHRIAKKYVESSTEYEKSCLVVSGLDFPKNFGRRLGQMNLQRDLYWTELPHTVFIVRDESLPRISEEAPDFWSRRSGIYGF